jgi:transcriptional regulator with XRE-family HTH domain
MRFEEKLRREMVLQGLNQQKLARLSGVSDSEVSRILGGKSQPGLENALKLARAIGVSLDYLADDTQDKPAVPRAGGSSPWAAEVLEVARECGFRESAQLLLAVRTIGTEVALRRIFGIDPPAPPPSPLPPPSAKDGHRLPEPSAARSDAGHQDGLAVATKPRRRRGGG